MCRVLNRWNSWNLGPRFGETCVSMSLLFPSRQLKLYFTDITARRGPWVEFLLISLFSMSGHGGEQVEQ